MNLKGWPFEPFDGMRPLGETGDGPGPVPS
jgi:hypothetical protein